MNPKFTDSYLILSASRALLGAISKQVMGICIAITGDTFTMTIYFEGEVTPEEKDELDSALAEIHADIYPEIFFSRIEFNENAQNPLVTKGRWVFLRLGSYGTNPNKTI